MPNEDTRELLQALDKVKVSCRKIKTYCKVSLVLFVIAWTFLISLIVLGLTLLKIPLPLTAKDIIDSLLGTLLAGTTLIIAYRIFADIVKLETPFTEKQVRRLRFLGRVILIYSAADVINSLVFYTIAMRDYFDFYVYHPDAPMPIMTMNTNVYMVLAGLACYAFAVIFKYGLLLQQLSDDTL